jgi:hypothetical protein
MLNLIIKEKEFSYSKRHLFDMLDLLVEKYQWKYIEKEEILNNNFYKLCQNKFNDIPKNILLITGSSLINHFKIDFNQTNVSYIIDDLHTGGEIKLGRIKSKDKIYKIFSTYGYCFNKFYPMIDNSKIVFFPHSARFIIPFNDNPLNKILVAGRVNQSQYPNRYLMLILSKKYSEIYYEKPKLHGYRANSEKDKEEKIYGEKFYQLLNQYLICFTCDANKKRPYLVAKHFEILASGSLLFTCNPNTKNEFESLGFIDGEDYLSCNEKNMEDKIKWLINPVNLKEINRIRKNGYEKVKKNHTWINRTEFLNKFFN